MLDPDISTADALRLLSRPASPAADAPGPAGWTRRRFLQAVGQGILAGAVGGPLLSSMLEGDVRAAFAAEPLGPDDHVVVLVGFYGGNDGLNTVVPYTDGRYYSMRPNIAIAADRVLRLDGTHGLHPDLAFLKQRWDLGEVAIVHGSGYPDPDLSHFTSMAIWMRSTFDTAAPVSGWVGRWLDGLPESVADMAVVTIGSGVPLHLQGVRRRAISIPEGGSLFGAETTVQYRRMYDGLRAMSTAPAGRGQWHDSYAAVLRNHLDVAQKVAPSLTPAPTGGAFVRKLTVAARLINADLGLRVVDLSDGGFDHHDGQPGRHNELLADFDAGLAAFYATLAPHLRPRVTLVTHSEFGRTPFSNQSAGTDHGTANVQFVIGPGVRGGHYGQPPSLAVSSQWDRLAHTVDFRDVFGTVLEQRMGGAASTVLGRAHRDLGFFHPLATTVPIDSVDGAVNGTLRPAVRIRG